LRSEAIGERLALAPRTARTPFGEPGEVATELGGALRPPQGFGGGFAFSFTYS